MTITQRLQPLLEYNTSKDYSHAPTTGWTTLAGLDWLEGVSFKMGRGDEQSAVTPSTISFVLDNIDGKYTPGNTSSTFYPNADTGLWVRFRLTDGTTTWPIFTGLTDSFIPTVAGPNAYKKVDVACSDILSRWTRFRGIKSCLHEEILLDAPLAYYPLDEGAGAQSFADVSGSVQPPLQVMSIGATGTLEPGGTTGPPGAGEQAPNFNPDYTSSAALGLDTGYGKYLLTNLKTPLVVGNGHAYTMEWWFKINNAGATADTPGANPFYPGLMMLDLTDPDTFYGGFYQTVGAIRPPASGGPYGRYGSNSQKLCILGSRLTTTAAQGRSGSLQPDIWHHFVCVSTGTNTSSSALFYMDGHFMGCVLDEPQAFNHQTMDPPPSTVRNLTYLLLAGLPAFGGMLLDGSIAHVALYPTALTQPRILQHYLAGRNGFQGETLRERLVRILRYLGQGDLTASAALDTSQIPVAKQGTTAALSLIHELETTEQGLFYIDPAGIPTFRNRSRRYVSPVLTLSMLPGDGDIEPDGLQPVLDEQRVLNDVTTTTTGGYVSRATDPTSIAARGTYEDSGVQTVGVSPTNADETSRWIVANRSVPSLRVPTVTVKLLTRPALWNAVLSADLLDQITFSNPIAGYNLGNLAIEGIAGKFGLRDADVTFTVTPNLPSPTVYTVGVAGSDELDTSTARLGF